MALVVYFIIPEFRDWMLLSTTGVLFFIGVVAAGAVEKTDGHDASIINLDEIVGMWVALLFLPRDLSFIWIVGSFFLFRGFDIWKPFPIHDSQKLPAGWGVMVDDLLAGIYTNLMLRLIHIII